MTDYKAQKRTERAIYSLFMCLTFPKDISIMQLITGEFALNNRWPYGALSLTLYHRCGPTGHGKSEIRKLFLPSYLSAQVGADDWGNSERWLRWGATASTGRGRSCFGNL